MTDPISDKGDTASRILDAAEQLVQTRGYNGFSYADIAVRLSITKASLHYHFPGKAELGEALIKRYSVRFQRALTDIDRDCQSAPQKLEAYADVYAKVLSDERMCLCGMLAAEYRTLPGPMRNAVLSFFDLNEGWLERVLVEGHRDGEIDFSGTAREAALLIIGGLEGAMLLSRPYDDPGRFRISARALLASILSDHP